MTDPRRPSDKTPARAEPIQPDRPGQGLDREKRPDDADDRPDSQAATKRRATQAETARDNVREGYD